MYKKITHTIIEEEFAGLADVNAATKLAKMPHKSRAPTTEVFSETIFKEEIKAYFVNYANNLNAMIDSVQGTNNQLITAFESMFANIGKLGSMFWAFYDARLAERADSALRGIALTSAIMAPIAKQNFSGPVYSVNQEKLSRYFNDLNNVFIAKQWTDLITPTAELATKVRSKFHAMADNQVDLSNQLSSEISTAFVNLGNLIADHIIAEFPDRFIMAQPATAQNYYWECPLTTEPPTTEPPMIENKVG